MGRKRSNALTGTNDPRYPAMMALKTEMKKPLVMADTLCEFLKLIYQSETIMSAKATTGGGINLADQIYDVYSKAGSNVSLSFKNNVKYFRDIWTVVKSHRVLRHANLQYTGLKLEKLIDSVDKYYWYWYWMPKKSKEKYYTDFIYFKVKGGAAKVRVYANVKATHVAKFVEFMKKIISLPPYGGIESFKVTGPGAISGRSDTVVIYCNSKQNADELANNLLKLKGYFNPQVPGMTSRVSPGIGIATGAEPARQATGLGVKPSEYGEDAQSFGTIRSELIAGAILNYNENMHVYGKGFDVFCKFVQVAFRGYGLDPTKPGN